MQVKHVLRGILLLRVGQDMGAPVGALLLLVQFDAQKLLDEILQAVAIGVGAGQFSRRSWCSRAGPCRRPDST